MEPQANEIRSEHCKRTATNQIALASRRARASKNNIAGFELVLRNLLRLDVARGYGAPVDAAILDVTDAQEARTARSVDCARGVAVLNCQCEFTDCC